MIIRTRFRLQRFYEVNRNSWHIWYYCKAYKQRLKHGTFQQVRKEPVVTQKSAGETAPMMQNMTSVSQNGIPGKQGRAEGNGK